MHPRVLVVLLSVAPAAPAKAVAKNRHTPSTTQQKKLSSPGYQKHWSKKRGEKSEEAIEVLGWIFGAQKEGFCGGGSL